MNLHKTFSTPHGGGGPGSGAVGVSKRLLPFMPVPLVGRRESDASKPRHSEPDQNETDRGHYYWMSEKELPQTIGRLSNFMGNAGVLLRAFVYMRMLGRAGMPRVAEYASLNANYLFARLKQAGFDAAYPERRASHEFIITLKRQSRELGVTAMDFAKRLLDYGFHAPTVYFPLLIPECLIIEPTETESKQTLDDFVSALTQILVEAKENPEILHQAPHTLPVKRLDDVKAARELNIKFEKTE